MKCNIRSLVFLVLPTFFIYADNGLAGFADGALVPIAIGTHFLATVFFIAGALFVITSFSFWRHYRQNPVFMPLSKILSTLLLGLVCLGIGYVNEPGKIINVQPKSPFSSSEKSISTKQHWSK
jgi:hypothetical protein